MFKQLETRFAEITAAREAAVADAARYFDSMEWLPLVPFKLSTFHQLVDRWRLEAEISVFTELPPIAKTPIFSCDSPTGNSVSFNRYRGRVRFECSDPKLMLAFVKARSIKYGVDETVKNLYQGAVGY